MIKTGTGSGFGDIYMKLSSKQIEFLTETSTYKEVSELLCDYQMLMDRTSFTIPLTEHRSVDVLPYFIEACLHISHHRDFWLLPCYTEPKVICISEEYKMKDTILVDIPSGSRSEYYSFLADINKLTGYNGNLLLFVNNIPYCPESKVWIFCRQPDVMQQIQLLIKANHLKIDKTHDSEDLIRETQYRRWNIHGIPAECTSVDLIASFCDKVFLFPEIAELKEKGYDLSKECRKPLVFISYCHANRKDVDQFISALDEEGINYWIDRVDMESGKSLVKSIMTSIDSSDLAITIVSKATLNSRYAPAELHQIISKAIMKEDQWCLVRLDDVDVDEILPGLSSYYYIDYQSEKDIHKLVNEVKKKLERQR